MRRRIFGLVCLVVGVTVMVPAVARAQSPPPNLYRSLESGKPARDAGEIHGRIVSVDYPSGQVVVREARRSDTVAVVPGTTIYRHGQYATLADLRPGQHVSISVYEVGGRLVAQTIRL